MSENLPERLFGFAVGEKSSLALSNTVNEDMVNTWIKCNGIIYPAGIYRECNLKNSIVQQVKTLGYNIKLKRIFDICDISININEVHLTAIMAALAHNREISIGFSIAMPDNTLIGIVIDDVFAGNFKSEIAYKTPENTVQKILKLQLFSKTETSLRRLGEAPFNKPNENFRLTHPLLQIADTLEDLKEREEQETSPKPSSLAPPKKITDMLSLQYNPYKGK